MAETTAERLAHEGEHGEEGTRRDFLYLVTGATTVVGAAALCWPLIHAMNPSADTLALASTEVDLSGIEEGMRITVTWRGKPVFISHRTPAEIEEARAVESARRAAQLSSTRYREGYVSYFEVIDAERLEQVVVHHDYALVSVGDRPVKLFESGAILLYLAQKTGRLMPKDQRAYWTAVQWLMWQMGGFGPMLGQAHHFLRFAKEDVPYAKDRYANETRRLYGVLDKRLGEAEWLVQVEWLTGQVRLVDPSQQR